MEDEDEFTIPTSPPSLKQKLKNSLCFSCCFTHRNTTTTQLHSLHYHHRPPPPPPPLSSSDENPTLIWIKPDIKDKCRTICNFIGNGNGNGNGSRHKRHSSAEFRYDPLSYSLNFEDEAPLRNFSSRLPQSPPPSSSSSPSVKNLGVAATGL